MLLLRKFRFIKLNNFASVKDLVSSLRLLSLSLLATMSIHHNKKRPVGVCFYYGALEKTRTSTAWGNMHLKHARLPIPPPGHNPYLLIALYVYTRKNLKARGFLKKFCKLRTA